MRFLKPKRLDYWILCADLLWMPGAFALSFILLHGLAGPREAAHSLWNYAPLILGAAAFWMWLFSTMKLDGFRLGWYMPAVASQLIIAIGMLILLLLAVDDLTRFYVSRLLLAYFGFLLFVGFVIVRRAIHGILRSSYLEGFVRRALIIGRGPVAREIAAKYKRHPEMLCQVVGFVCSEDEVGNDLAKSKLSSRPTMPTMGIIDLLRANRIDEVIVTLTHAGADIVNLIARCRIDGIRVSVLPHPYELYLSKPELVDVGGLPVLQLREANAAFADSVGKRILDLVLATLAATVAFPIGLAGMFILRHRPGGGLCSEMRCGKGGVPFAMYRLNSERNREGITGIEWIFQQLSVTELPQLWNVLSGDMSLVGPRPEQPDRVKHYSDWQSQRLNVKPGITGLAQVHGLREQNSSEEKTRYDLQYMLNSSLFLDLSLLMQTGWTLITRFLRLPGSARSESEILLQAGFDPLFDGTLPNAHRTQSSSN